MRSKTETLVTLGVLCLVFLGAGAGLGWFLFGKPISAVWAAKGWEETPCAILHSRFDEDSRIRDARTLVFSKVVVQYRYSYDGRAYVGDRYDFSVGESTGNYSNRYMAAQELKAGNTDVCYVNPANPSEAVFRRSTGLSRDDKLLACVPAAFVAVGLLGLPGVVVARRLAVAGNRCVYEASIRR